MTQTATQLLGTKHWRMTKNPLPPDSAVEDRDPLMAGMLQIARDMSFRYSSAESCASAPRCSQSMRDMGVYVNMKEFDRVLDEALSSIVVNTA